MNILLGVTGSVAATLTPRLISAFAASGVYGEVQVAATASSLYFWKMEDNADARVWTDDDEWESKRYVRGQPIRHIELRKWADVLVIAPLSADTLAKLAHGRADNLLTCVARAWDLRKPVVVAPAMNTMMWNHPATAEHLATLRRWYGERFVLVPPVAKKLACGDEGIGAMADITDIVQAVARTRPM